MRRTGPVAAALAVLIVPSGAISQTRDAGAASEALALQAFSEGKGPPLVMLGGGIHGAAGFLPHAQVLAEDFRVVRLQTLNVERALAQQDLPAGYSVKTESAAMTVSLDRLGLTGPVDLVGHSFGALVALDFALDHPARVRTLVLAEPPAFWAVPPAELRTAADLHTMYTLLQELEPASQPTDDQLMRFRCALGVCGERPPAPADAGSAQWAARRASLRGLSVVAAHTDDPERLRRFRRPVLIVTGASTVRFHRRINDVLAAALPSAERAELPGGHAAPSTARDEFVTILREFTSRQGGARARTAPGADPAADRPSRP